jgi:programmed cell death 6-interacting protein
MDDEERVDTGLKDRFKDKWTRQPSSVLFKEVRAEANKYMTILTNATQADGIVRSKYDTHINGMTLLSKSQDEVIAAIPKGGPSAGDSSSPVRRLVCW